MNARYNYMDALKADIKDFIDNEIDLNEYGDIDDLNDYLNDVLFTTDSVTGNASGSYTFNRYQAAEYVNDNHDVIRDLISEGFLTPESFTEYFINSDYESLDVIIRCYLLSAAINEVLEDIEL